MWQFVEIEISLVQMDRLYLPQDIYFKYSFLWRLELNDSDPGTYHENNNRISRRAFLKFAGALGMA